MTFGEWNEIKDLIKFDYQEDNHFSELRDAEVLRERLTLLQEIDQYTGKYFSTDWIRTNVLKQTDEEKEDIDKQIELQKKRMNGSYTTEEIVEATERILNEKF